MKNKLLSQNAVTHFFYSLSLMLLFTNLSWGQVQTIGSFPYMDGGFEGQTAGIVPKITFYNVTTNPTGPTSSSVWSAQTGSGDSTINSNAAVARTGSKYATGVDATTTYARVLQSPTAASGYPADLTTGAYVVQYWIKNSTLAEIPAGVGPSGSNYQLGRQAIGTNVTTWTKYTQIATSSADSESTSYVGIGRVRVVGSFLVDDVVVYAGTAADVTAPLAASGGVVSGLNVSWTASSDVDGGGYMVVRYATNPNLDNDPNANGIYAVGNTITNGTGSLIGTVVYTGTGTSFTDNVAGSVSGSDYYKVYAVDKAFNYATEIKATSVVSTTPTITSSIETLTGFNYTGVGPSASQSFVVSGSILTNNLVVSATSTDFELSQDNFATAGVSSITLTAPTVAPTTLYVRLKSGLTGGLKTATVTIASTGANTLPTLSLSGSVTNVFYYNGIGALSDASSWGANTDGTGANPAGVTATYTNFVITGSATTAAAWTLGVGSKVIVGNGSAVSLTVADTFPITGTIDAAANGSVLWQVATPAIVGPPAVYYSPTFGTLDSASEVHLQPATAADYALGIGTAYGKLFIDGAGKVSVVANLSTATVKTGLTVASGSTLSFPVTNTHSITINAGASTTIEGTVRAGKQGGLLGSTTDTPAATTTAVSILFVGTPNLTLGASSTIDYYRPNAPQTVSALPSGVNYANLTLSETNANAATTKSIVGAITVNGTLTVDLAGKLFTSVTSGANNITLASGATINLISGTLNAAPTFAGTVNVTYSGLGFTKINAATTIGSTAVTLASADAAIVAGMAVTGTAVAPGTTVASISGTALVLSAAATATEAAVKLSFATGTAQTTGFEVPTAASNALNNLTINNSAGVILAAATKGNSIIANTDNTLTLSTADLLDANVQMNAGSELTLNVNANQANLKQIVFSGATGTTNATTAKLKLNMVVDTQVTFTDSSVQDWGTGTIEITGFQEGKIRFGSSNLALTSTQLGLIKNMDAPTMLFGLDALGYLVDSTTLGTNDLEFANNTISLYPNPAQEVLNVSSANSITKIEVYDLLGKKVASNNNAKNVNVAALGKGVYVVKVVQENGSVVAKRFIKQ